MATDGQILQIQQASDIVDLIGQHIRLQPRGREFVGLCPFHDDHSPSFYVSPAKQIYKCFSCNAGGNVFSWMTNYHKMSFPEALKHLATNAGITLTSTNIPTEATGERTERGRLSNCNAKGLEFFRSQLHDARVGKIARDYLENRGISSAMAQQFQLGYGPDRWDALTEAIARHGWSVADFQLAGLINQKQHGSGAYDRMRHRLIFPICDALGRPIAFGGRILPNNQLDEKNQAKYLNTPESALFNKSATLYGLHLAKKAITAQRQVAIVEGYTDVIACHQTGFSNTVGTLGTALTSQHVQFLRRFVEQVVLVFDADTAGQKAADRAAEIFLTGNIDVRVAILPTGSDPADLLLQGGGTDQWKRLLEDAVDALDYQFQRTREQFDATGTITGRQRLAEDYIRRLAQMGLARHGLIRRAMIIQKLAGMLNLPASKISAMIQQASARAMAQNSAPDVARTSISAGRSRAEGSLDEKNYAGDVASSESVRRINALRMAERQLIGGLLKQPHLFRQALSDGRTLEEAVTPTEMLSTSARQIYSMMYEQLCEGRAMTLATLLAELASQQQEQALCDLVTDAESEVERITDQNDTKLRELVDAASSSLLSYHREIDHRRTVSSADASATDSDVVGERMLMQVQEHHRAHPPPMRIARLDP